MSSSSSACWIERTVPVEYWVLLHTSRKQLSQRWTQAGLEETCRCFYSTKLSSDCAAMQSHPQTPDGSEAPRDLLAHTPFVLLVSGILGLNSADPKLKPCQVTNGQSEPAAVGSRHPLIQRS
ncbi:hypothetical protein FQA47_013128 [Oryzias melastigma]|uniref:Uncharacterized protein n=1 Tax=Oryzias melastigma TaxID=30732 RepID=A0A834C0T9_ORYME|nr:hypothetical protein FQA47_013128 [Oryzias melastigma]